MVTAEQLAPFLDVTTDDLEKVDGYTNESYVVRHFFKPFCKLHSVQYAGLLSRSDATCTWFEFHPSVGLDFADDRAGTGPGALQWPSRGEPGRGAFVCLPITPAHS